jgi:hypothetical protein
MMKDYPGEPGAAGAAPANILKQLRDAERKISALEVGWHEALAFFDGDQYVEISGVTGRLERLETREGTASKPRHRHRRIRNRFTPTIVRESAMCSSRVPVFECNPINGDNLLTGEARLEEKVLLGAYQQFGLKNIAVDVMNYALVTGAGFTWAFFNPDRGRFLLPEEGKWLREGEIEIQVLHQGEVLWDGGAFEDSRWYCVRKALPLERVKDDPQYRGPKGLTADAQTGPFEARKGQEQRDLVFVYHYLERPCQKYRNGRYLKIAQGQLLAPEAPYPYKDPDGQVIDEPVLQYLPFVSRRHRARPMGMGEMLVPIQRDINRMISQILTIKDLAQAPQVFAPVGSLRQQLDSTPGAVWEYRPVSGLKPEWRAPMEVPSSMWRALDQALADWQDVSGQNQLPAGVESGSAIQAINERDADRRAAFISHLSSWYANLGERLLHLMRVHYTEERLMLVRGRFGTESIRAFRGSRLRPVKVRVAEGSIQPRTREAQKALIAQLIDKGLVDPRKAIAAMQAGTADSLIDSYELDVAKANREIQQLVASAEMQGRGVPMVDETADDHAVHLEVLSNWMKTEDYEMQKPFVQEAAKAHAQWHETALEKQKLEAAAQQTAAAEQLGAQNAAAPQAAGPKPMPSQPSLKTSAEGAKAAGF